MAKRTLYLLFLGLLFFLPSGALAGETLDTLEQSIEAFLKSPDSRFAPATAARAQAILGAALMADRRHDTKALEESIQAAEATLSDARRLAHDFREKYAGLLQLEQAAVEATGEVSDPQLNAAKVRVRALAESLERGKLNESVKLAAAAQTAFSKILNSKLVPLLNKTDAALIAASRAGAKRYAPVTYAAAQKWQAGARAYTDGLSKVWPLHPRLGLVLAERAREMAVQVKQWRKHAESHEALVLKARKEQLQIARALGMAVNPDDPAAEVHVNALVRRINDLTSDLERERQIHRKDIARLKQAHAQEMETKLAELRDEMARQQSKQAGELKEAYNIKLERLKAGFHTKLEQETFETRRQQQLHKLFKKGEVKILANLDGSLLIRLSTVKFAPGKADIDQKYFNLLSRVKTGLDKYPERKITIEGHTDNKGDARANQKLSLKRAEAVRDFLIAAGMAAGRLKALGYGEVRPVASNDYERGRSMNRRIDILIQAGP